MAVLYPRDLSGTLKQDFENQLKEHRPDLVKAYEDGEDITIGEVKHLEPKDWSYVK